jgi:hypothetical protein
METLVNCASCGKKKEFGSMYTSQQIHNDMGFGYSVCEECYKKECELRKQYKE